MGSATAAYASIPVTVAHRPKVGGLVPEWEFAPSLLAEELWANFTPAAALWAHSVQLIPFRC